MIEPGCSSTIFSVTQNAAAGQIGDCAERNGTGNAWKKCRTKDLNKRTNDGDNDSRNQCDGGEGERLGLFAQQKQREKEQIAASHEISHV